MIQLFGDGLLVSSAFGRDLFNSELGSAFALAILADLLRSRAEQCQSVLGSRKALSSLTLADLGIR